MKPYQRRLQRKLKEEKGKRENANRKVLLLKRYINELEEMIYVNVDPTGFEGRDEAITQDISRRVNECDTK